jgi:hypothetical protein
MKHKSDQLGIPRFRFQARRFSAGFQVPKLAALCAPPYRRHRFIDRFYDRFPENALRAPEDWCLAAAFVAASIVGLVARLNKSGRTARTWSSRYEVARCL